MALTQRFRSQRGAVKLRSGQFYSFRYTAFQHDPEPLVLFLFYRKGKNPSTGHQWNLYQCINLHYLPQRERMAFFNFYKRSLRGRFERFIGRLTWRAIERRYPSLVPATRRYNPRFIKSLWRIDTEDIPERLKTDKYVRKFR
jgi:hypothetical protein